MPEPLDLLLASTSPRRHELLQAAGLRFSLCAPGPEYEHGNEHAAAPGQPLQLARQRARNKALGAAPARRDVPVLGVDTVVDLDGVELGKARDPAAAETMLRSLFGRIHRVHTAHCLFAPASGRVLERSASATVACRAATDAELRAYLDSKQWLGKAGAYGIQDPAQSFLTLVDGAFDTVVGLHVPAVEQLLRQMVVVP